MRGLGVRSTTNTEKYVYINNPNECDACAQRCFEIIKHGREKGTITIKGEYSYPEIDGVGYHTKKTLGGDYVVHNSQGEHFIVYISGDEWHRNGYVAEITVGDTKFVFNKSTNNTIFLKSTIFGYFKDKDAEETLRAKQQEQAMQRAQESKRDAGIASAKRFLDEMYKGM